MVLSSWPPQRRGGRFAPHNWTRSPFARGARTRRPAIFTIGLDLHKRETQLCIGHEDGTIEERRIVTSRDRFTAVLNAYVPARTLLESSTESERVARHLEQMGHEVIVADPNFAPMYATRPRRTKTDPRGARTRYIAVIKALIRRDGLRLNSTASHIFGQRIAALDASPQLRAELQPLLDLLVR